jgi:hypothetical protein
VLEIYILQPEGQPNRKTIDEDMYKSRVMKGRVGKGISAQASHKTVLEILTSHGFSHSA